MWFDIIKSIDQDDITKAAIKDLPVFKQALLMAINRLEIGKSTPLGDMQNLIKPIYKQLLDVKHGLKVASRWIMSYSARDRRNQIVAYLKKYDNVEVSQGRYQSIERVK
tara:strand:+ start:800 stop:1126 length:327 start_codon:yes stop_codon:yes gene_type:complete